MTDEFEVQAQPETQSQQSTDKMVNSAEVNRAIGAIKNEYYERGRRDAQQQAPAAPALTRQEMEAMINEKASALFEENNKRYQEQQANYHAAQKTIDSWSGKIMQGKEKFEDFEEVMKTVDFREHPDIVSLTDLVDNTDEVVYELLTHPAKFGNIKSLLVNNKTPMLAQKAIQKLSASIKQNRTAKAQNENVREPSRQIKVSSTTTPAKVDDDWDSFRKADWLKG